MKKLYISLFLSLFCLTANAQPKYVFFFIGDGFGLSQKVITQAYLSSMKGEHGVEELTMTSFPNMGYFYTHSYGQLITDSAAGGTALASGVKTTDGTLGLDHEGNRVENIAEIFSDRGMKVGIISTASIDHATPASFYAHQASRNDYYEIAQQLPESGFDYFAGGGVLSPTKDGGISFEEKAKSKGYRFVNTKKGIDRLKKGDERVIVTAPNLQDSKSMTYAIDQDESDINLAYLVDKGIEVLTSPKGFFMMIESGKIDWACHAQDVATTIHEVLDFDESIKVAYDFYKKHPEETLIIVCADHETGGMTLGSARSKYKSNYALFSNQNMSYYALEQEMKQLVKDSKSTLEHGLELLKRELSFNREELTKYDLERLSEAFAYSMQSYYDRERTEAYFAKYSGYDPFITTAITIQAEKAGVGMTTFAHTATPVIIHSIGKSSEIFEGVFDNTDVPKKINSLYK